MAGGRSDDSSEDRDLAQRLRDLELRYSVMVEQAPEAIVVFDLDDDYFVEVNAQACQLYGMERAELLRRKGPVSLSPRRQPDGRLSSEAVAAYIQRTMAGEMPHFEWTHVRPSGEEVLCRIQLARVPSRGHRLVRASMVDISDRKASEQERERLRAIIDATPDLMGMADARGNALYINPATRALLEIPADEDVTRLSIDSFHPEDTVQRLRDEGIPTAIREGIWRAEVDFLTRSGRRIPTSQVLIAHKNELGELEYLSTIARDIRDQRAAQRLEREMLHRHKLESLGLLAGGIAHDFNNILVGVLGNAELLLRRLPEGECHELARELGDAAQRAAGLAEQMLAYVGRASVTESPVRLDELLREVRRLVDASISKHTTLRFELTEDLPAVSGDPTQLGQVLMNLLINASEALGDSPGTVTVRTYRETIDRPRLTHDYLPASVNDVVTMEVEDTGPGMTKEVFDRVFDPFFTTKFTGRGLGLSAVLGIVRGHQGGILVESEPGRFTRFRLHFAPTPEASANTPPPVEESSAPTGHGTVLVVDDEALVRRVMRMTLEDAGFHVIEAVGGPEALRILEGHTGPIDAAIVDLTMPEMSGDQLVERLRALRPALAIVLASGYAAPSSVEGVCAFLRKPFRPDELVETLRQVLPADAPR